MVNFNFKMRGSSTHIFVNLSVIANATPEEFELSEVDCVVRFTDKTCAHTLVALKCLQILDWNSLRQTKQARSVFTFEANKTSWERVHKQGTLRLVFKCKRGMQDKYRGITIHRYRYL